VVIIDKVVGLVSTIKVDVIQKYLVHVLVKGMVPKYLYDLNNVQQIHEVLTNVQIGLITHLTCSHPTKIMVVKEIVYTFISYDNLHSNKAIARVLRVDRQNIKRGVEKHVLLDTMIEAFWINH
jgi:hypothetical protein